MAMDAVSQLREEGVTVSRVEERHGCLKQVYRLCRHVLILFRGITWHKFFKVCGDTVAEYGKGNLWITKAIECLCKVQVDGGGTVKVDVRIP